MKKIVLCSGGTGGHIFPAISLLKSLSEENETVLVTDKRAFKYINLPKEKVKILNVSSLKKNIVLNIFSIFKLFFSIIDSVLFLKKEKIDAVVGLGGYVSFPILLSAKILNKKIYLYEPNLVLGRVNKFFLGDCEKIFVHTNSIINVPKKYSLKFIQVGNIIREEILNYPNTENKNNEEDTRIIILGGSQGAKIFGEVIPKAILNLVKKNIKLNILQQVLPEQKDDIELFYKKNMIKNYTFIFDKNIISLMAKSDLAISRSGASTLAELDFLQIPFIAVPYPHAKDNHQYENALYYKKKQSCWI